jgi:hypothetical protein
VSFRWRPVHDRGTSKALSDLADDARRRDPSGQRPGVPLRLVHGNYAITTGDTAVVYDGAGGHTLATPDAAEVGNDMSVMIRISNRGAGSISVEPFRSAQKINGGATPVAIAAGGAGLLFSDGDGWKLVQ